jgi:uncharacterized protein (TIRG00374 family)
MITFLRDQWRKPAARILTSLLILGVLFLNLPVTDIWQTMRQISIHLLAFVVIAFILGHLLGAIKWRLLINAGKNRLPYFAAFRCYFAGLFATLFLPSLAGGDLIRAGLAIRYKTDKEAVFVGSLIDRFLDSSSLVLIILVAAACSPGILADKDRKVLVWFVMMMAIFGLSIIFLLLGHRPKKLPDLLVQELDRLDKVFRNLVRNPSPVLVGLVISLIIQAGFVLLNTMLGAACGIHLPLAIWFLAWPLAKLAAMLPISLGGLGVREVAFAVILSRFSVPFSSSVGLGLLWESVLITGSAMGGGFYLLSSRNVKESSLVISEDKTSKSKTSI